MTNNPTHHHHPLFPFAALVGLDEMQLALQLAAIDHRLSVLLRGDKGAGKSTAARGLGALLAEAQPGVAAPFVNLPIGATEDRVLGGLDLARTLDGEPALKPGLLSAAHGGVLYVDEINLLPDHLADAMLDAAASGLLIVEREGFSRTQSADFVLVGSMNPEEGALRPQLLDRFALVVDVEAPMAPAERRVVVQRRLAFERDPSGFVETWRARDAELAAAVREARERLAHVSIDEPLIDAISEQVCAHDVRSLRADLAIVRASRALAALDGAETVTIDHVARVLPLALRHRAGRMLANGLSNGSPNAPKAVTNTLPDTPDAPQNSATLKTSPPNRSSSQQPRPSTEPQSPMPPSSDSMSSASPLFAPSTSSAEDPSRSSGDASGSSAAQWDADGRDGDRNQEAQADATADAAAAEPGRVFAAREVQMPRIVTSQRPAESARGTGATGNHRSSAAALAAPGPAIRSRVSAEPRELDARATLVHAIARTGTSRPRVEDLHEIVRVPIVERRYLFVIDASGSQAVQQRMRLVKGAVEALLGQSVRRRDEVAIISFRGPQAEIVLTPTSDLESARQALRYLPTGGRTPLAHALELAATLVAGDTILVLLTDGRANVANATDDPWADALTAASHVSCAALVIDSETNAPGARATGRAAEIAARMRATHVRMDTLDQQGLIEIDALVQVHKEGGRHGHV